MYKVQSKCIVTVIILSTKTTLWYSYKVWYEHDMLNVHVHSRHKSYCDEMSEHENIKSIGYNLELWWRCSNSEIKLIITTKIHQNAQYDPENNYKKWKSSPYRCVWKSSKDEKMHKKVNHSIAKICCEKFVF